MAESYRTASGGEVGGYNRQVPLRFVTFQQALDESAEIRRHLLLGNGFSISLFPERFRYGALLEEADFSDHPEVRKAFDVLGTTDFEVVIDALKRAVLLASLYGGSDGGSDKMASDAEALKEILVRTIAGRHPERPADIPEERFEACRKFLAHFVGESRARAGAGGSDRRGHIYTLNYDLLLYWTLMHNEVVRWDSEDLLNFEIRPMEPLLHDDGFREPDLNPSARYVAWDGEDAANNQNVHFLHGALHLFDCGAELQKKCWERSGGIALIDQIREALNDGKFPLFVSEGSTDSKFERIRHSGYLQRCLRSFAAVCRSKDAALFVLGHSLAANDEHVLRQIEKGKVGRAYISLHEDPASEGNRAIIARAERMAAARTERAPLDVAFFDSSQAKVWDPS
jgi:hypothetical protein